MTQGPGAGQFPPGQQAAPTCYRHPDRESHVRCQRCNRPICPDCMNQAAVGFQCPNCVREGAKATRANRTPYGGSRSGNPALTSYVLIGLNVAVWLLIVLTGGNASRWVDDLALLPANTDWAFDGQPAVQGVAGGAWWQLLTSAFTHVAVLHIAFNMLALWFLGPQLESVLGRARFLAVYLVSALTGSVAVMWLAEPYTQTVGASGAIFGLMGALVVVALKIKSNPSQILVWLGLNLYLTLTMGSQISWQGHLGGLAGGALATALLVYAPKANRGAVQWVGVAALVVASLVLIGLRIAALT